MSDLRELLEGDHKFIIISREIYDKIIPVDQEDIDEFIKNRKYKYKRDEK